MVFHSNDAAGLTDSSLDGLFVERLQGVQVDHANRQTVLVLEEVGSLYGTPHASTAGDDGEVGAFTEHIGTTDTEVLNGLFVYNLVEAAVDTNVDGTIVLVGSFHSLGGGHTVGGVENDHACEGAHDGDVLCAVVGRTCLAGGGASVGGDDLDVLLVVANVRADLLACTHRGESGEGRHERGEAGGGETGSDAHHVLLSNTNVEEALGELIA